MKRTIQIALISLVGSLAFAGPKVASDMPHSTASGMVDVIVQYKSFAGMGSADRRARGAASAVISAAFRQLI